MLVRRRVTYSLLKCDECGGEGCAVIDDGPKSTRARWKGLAKDYGAEQAPGPRGRWKCDGCRHPSPLMKRLVLG